MRDLKIYACGVDVPEGYELTKEEEDKLAQDNAEHENGLRVNQVLYKAGFKAGREATLDDQAAARCAVDTLITMLESFSSYVTHIRDITDSEAVRIMANDAKKHYDALDYVLADLVEKLQV